MREVLGPIFVAEVGRVTAERDALAADLAESRRVVRVAVAAIRSIQESGVGSGWTYSWVLNGTDTTNFPEIADEVAAIRALVELANRG